MRISTAQLFGAPTRQMSALTAQADALQAQIATGKRVLTPGDDPVAYQRLALLRRAGADDAAFSANVKLAQGLLAEADTALAGIEGRLQRAQELALAGRSETLTPSDRALIADELDALVTDILNLANIRDSRGQPIFGGADGGQPFVRQGDGSIAWAGSGAPSSIPIGEGNAIAVAETGNRVLGGLDDGAGGETDVFAILSGLVASLRPGPADANAGIDSGIEGIARALEQVATARTSVGARAIRLDFESERLAEAAITRETNRAGLEDADLATTIAELQKTLTVLQATQASFTRLSSLSLFDLLR